MDVLYFLRDHVWIIIYIINILLSLVIIFFDNKTPSATLAWIMILFILPGFGVFLYLILSQHIARLKINKMTKAEENFVDSITRYQTMEIKNNTYEYINQESKKWNSLILFNLEYANSPMTDNTSIELITDGKEKFARLLEDIENAKESINVCYFIVKNDFVGQALIEALTKKAKEGLEVKLLVDAMGSKSIGEIRLSEFKKAGGKCAFFFKPIIKRLFFRINYRNHRKLVIIDKKIGYIGGFNIAKEYLGYKKKFGYWRDTHIRIIGNAVFSMNQRFMMDWRYASKEQDIDLIEYILPDDFYESLSGEYPIQIVSSGPETSKEAIKMAMMKMITSAKKSIYIQTPYLVPDQAIIQSLKMAAQSGVDVNIMIPCMPDHPFVYHTTKCNAGELIPENAKIYIYENGFLHAKTLVVDDEVCTIGSTNFDIRSFKLNFETNAFIYHKGFAKEMVNQFKEDVKLSRPYTHEDRNNRTAYDKAAERISRLLADVL